MANAVASQAAASRVKASPDKKYGSYQKSANQALIDGLVKNISRRQQIIREKEKQLDRKRSRDKSR
jgi:hypothetical protein